jgi:GTP-binding protein Era
MATDRIGRKRPPKVPAQPAEPGLPLRPFQSGFVAVIGLPNAGKSTLVNHLVGRKVAIVSSKPQTTRNRIVGIVHRPGAQIVLVDTPGLHQPATALDRRMMAEIDRGIEGVDLVAVIVDAARGFIPQTRFLLERARQFNGPVFLLLNKIDRIEKPHLLPLIDAFRRERDWAEIIPISALTGEGLDVLLDLVVRLLPVGEPFFPPDQFTDQPERFLAAEFVREKALALTRQEVPHSVGVTVDRFEESDRLIKIYATILVDREGQRGILVGKAGESIKRIGTLARAELEKLLGVKIYLGLYVKVQPGWRDNPAIVDQLDWRRDFEQNGED